MSPKPTNQYLEKQILNASPAEQIVMLYDGAIKFMLKAKDSIEKGDIQERFNNNKRAGDIIAYLLSILDTDVGGDVAGRLGAIYGHLLKRMLDVDAKNDAAAAEEVVDYLRTLRQSWVEIAEKEKLGDKELAEQKMKARVEAQKKRSEAATAAASAVPKAENAQSEPAKAGEGAQEQPAQKPAEEQAKSGEGKKSAQTTVPQPRTFAHNPYAKMQQQTREETEEEKENKRSALA